MHLPDGVPRQQSSDSTLIKALARAFRWKRMLESGDFASISELADNEGIAPSYIARVLRLSLLAPEVVENILNGKSNVQIRAGHLTQPHTLLWATHSDGTYNKAKGRRATMEPRNQ